MRRKHRELHGGLYMQDSYCNTLSIFHAIKVVWNIVHLSILKRTMLDMSLQDIFVVFQNQL